MLSSRPSKPGIPEVQHPSHVSIKSPNVTPCTLANRQGAGYERTGYHAGIVRPGEWPAGEKIDVRYP